MDQRHLHSASAFNNRLPHAYSQAPSSHHHPLVSFPTHQQYLQPHQTSRPYLSSQDQVRIPNYQHWSHNHPQRSNAMIGSGTQRSAPAMGIGNYNNRNHLSVPLLPGEDLISLDDQPVIPSCNSMPFQRMQSLPQPLNTVGRPAVIGQYTTPSYLDNVQGGGNLQCRMDNTIHHTRQPQILPQYGPFGSTPGYQNPGMKQAGAYHNFVFPQQTNNSGYIGSQTPHFPVPFQQAPRPRGLFNFPTPADDTSRPVTNLGPFQHGMVNNRSGSASCTSNIRSNTLAQNTGPRVNLPRNAKPFVVFEKEGASKTVSIPVVPVAPSPGTKTAVDAGQIKQVANPVVPPIKLETNPQHSARERIIKQQIAKVVSLPTCPWSQLEQRKGKLGHNAVTRKRSPKNRQANSWSRNVPTVRNNPPKDSGKLPEKIPPHNVVAQSQTAKRIIRKVLFNDRAGEVKQGPDKDVARNKSPEIVESQAPDKEELQSNKDETVSDRNYSTPKLQPEIEMPLASSKISPNPGKRLLSFDELCRSSSNTVEQAPHPSISSMTEAGKDRPLTLNELMQLRDDAASKSSNSTTLGSPSLGGKADQQDSSDGSQVSSEQSSALVIRPSLDTSRQLSLTDSNQGLTENVLETQPMVILPAPKQSLFSVEVKSTSTPTIPQAVGSSNTPISEAANSTTTESSTNPCSVLDPTSLKDDPAEEFPCRFCPDEYRTASSRDSHESTCRRKAGWPKNCCFCGVPLSNRDTLTVHAQSCTKTRAESLQKTSLSKYVLSNSATKANKQTPAANSSGSTTKVTRAPTQASSAPSNGTSRRNRKGTPGAAKLVPNAAKTGINTEPNMITNKTPTPTPTAAVQAHASTSTPNEPSTSTSNRAAYRSRRRRRAAKKPLVPEEKKSGLSNAT